MGGLRALLDRYDPVVPRRILPLLAGVVWGGVGVMLSVLAGRWLARTTPATAAAVGVAGSLVGLLLARTMFRRLVMRNLARLEARPARTCLFSLFPWRSWAIALLMSVMGATLRRAGVPRVPLAGVYVAMGLSLLGGAFLYLQAFFGRRDV